jgi:gentisate 1,2-dioxygenase
MHEGDFIITPPWAWHDHGNPSNEPIFWLDGLDGEGCDHERRNMMVPA